MSRADVLPPHWLVEYDRTVLPVAMFNCGGCGWPTHTLGDRVRHVNEDGTCPIEPLAQPGYAYLDRVLFWRTVRPEKGRTEDHIFTVTVHRLKWDGSPMMWLSGAQHSDLCACMDESPVLDSESGTA